MIFRNLTCVTTIMFFLTLSINTNGQSQERIYSQLILNLSRGILWPNPPSTEKFVIGVLEYPPLAAELVNAAVTFKIGARKVEVKEI